jgi:hypothetical protein
VRRRSGRHSRQRRHHGQRQSGSGATSTSAVPSPPPDLAPAEHVRQAIAKAASVASVQWSEATTSRDGLVRRTRSKTTPVRPDAWAYDLIVDARRYDLPVELTTPLAAQVIDVTVSADRT